MKRNYLLGMGIGALLYSGINFINLEREYYKCSLDMNNWASKNMGIDYIDKEENLEYIALAGSGLILSGVVKRK